MSRRAPYGRSTNTMIKYCRATRQKFILPKKRGGGADLVINVEQLLEIFSYRS
ncbi:hypothetical protein BIW11_03008 [Tropilaelaps mercedesae]|uniref:Uncharacterized protein n=1 Tax=Tropilaelaps mercedesae TaxID=418985 RepID=A0A1V9XTD9_9ACAR|nr:hypothetical protein BIW11_03008 [Tropilaelaps mercedesae]